MADVAEHVESVEQPELVTGNEIGLLHQVGRPNRLRTEAQVRHGHRTGLLRVVHEVALRIQIGFVTDDLDRRLVRTDGAVAAERVEHRRAPGLIDEERVVDVEAQVGDIVDDADGEASLGCVEREFVEHRLGHRRGELLRAEAVPTTDRPNARAIRLGDGGDDILEERFTDRPGLLAAVEHRDRSHGVGERVEQRIDRKRSEQSDGGDADLLAVGHQLGHRLADRAGARTHHHDDPLGVRSTFVVDESVAPTGARLELGEHVGDDAGHCVVEPVAGFTRLEEHIGILCGAAHDGCGGAESAGFVGGDVLVANQRLQVVVAEQLDAVDLVRGTEPVEEVQERHSCPERGSMRDRREVVSLLDRTGAQHGEPGRSSGHDVAVVTEDRQRMRGDRSGSDVDDRWGEFAGDLEHVGQHQQQPLRRSEGGAHRSGLQGAVQGAGCARFGLQLHHFGHRAPQVRCAAGRPGVGELTHRRGRSDRIDRHHLRQRVGDLGCRFVAVDACRRRRCWRRIGSPRVSRRAFVDNRGAHDVHPCGLKRPCRPPKVLISPARPPPHLRKMRTSTSRAGGSAHICERARVPGRNVRGSARR